MAGKTLGDIYTQRGFRGSSSGSMSLDYLDELFTTESGTGVWDLSSQYSGGQMQYGIPLSGDSPFITDDSGEWAYEPDTLGKEDLYWEYDPTKEMNIEAMYGRKMESLSGTIDEMFRETKANKLKSSINVGRSNLISGRHLDEIKAISEDAGIKLHKTKADINIDAIKTDMKVQNIRKQYEANILSTSDELGLDADILADQIDPIIDQHDVGKYSLRKGSVGDEITINGVVYRWKNYKTVWKWRGKTRSYGWVKAGAGPDQGNHAGGDDWDSL